MKLNELFYIESEESAEAKIIRHLKDLDDLERSLRQSKTLDKETADEINSKRKSLMLKKAELSEANPEALGKMNDKMKDLLSKVHDGDEAEKQAKIDAEEKAKADIEKAATMYAMKHPEEMEDYIAKLKAHDWTYMYSDDNRYYTKGSQEAKEIDALKKKLDPTGKIYNKYNPFKESVQETATAGATGAGSIASDASAGFRNGGIGTLSRAGTVSTSKPKSKRKAKR